MHIRFQNLCHHFSPHHHSSLLWKGQNNSTFTQSNVSTLYRIPPIRKVKGKIAKILNFLKFLDFLGRTPFLGQKHRSFYSTTISVLLGSPSPALLTAMMRYSSSLPFGCSTNVASVITAVAVSSHTPAGRSLR